MFHQLIRIFIVVVVVIPVDLGASHSAKILVWNFAQSNATFRLHKPDPSHLAFNNNNNKNNVIIIIIIIIIIFIIIIKVNYYYRKNSPRILWGIF